MFKKLEFQASYFLRKNRRNLRNFLVKKTKKHLEKEGQSIYTKNKW